MKILGRYPDPVVVRVRTLRVLPLLTVSVGVTVLVAWALRPQFAKPPAALIGVMAFLGACTLVFLVLAIWRPITAQLTLQGIQAKHVFAGWNQVVAVTPFRASTGRGSAASMVVVDLDSLPATDRDKPVRSQQLWISCQFAINRHRLAELITDYHNAWAAEHGKPLLPPPSRGVSW